MHAMIRTTVLTLIIVMSAAGAVSADISGENGKTIPAAVVNIPVTHVVEGEGYTGSGEFGFVLAAADEENPMPAGSDGRVKTVTAKGSDDPDFGDIVFEYPGEYFYAVSRIRKDYDNLKTDREEYRVMIAKLNDGTTQMIMWNSGGEKVDEILYTDEFRLPKRSSPKTGDDTSIAEIMACLSVGFATMAALVLVIHIRKETADEE